MKSILEDFACGNIRPELRPLEHNSEYEKAVTALTEAEAKVRAVLNETDKALLNTLIEAQGAVSHIANTDRFVQGYKLGVRMTTEVFYGKDNV